MALTEIQKIRIEVGDFDETLPILSDEEYQYFLDKNKGNIAYASMDASRTILFKLSQRTDETVDILSIKGSRAAEQYRLALQLFIKNPTLNPIISNAKAWFGGVSLNEMDENNRNPDNNIVSKPSADDKYPRLSYFGNFNKYGI